MAPGALHINSLIGAIVAFGPAEVRSEPQREPPHVRPVERGGSDAASLRTLPVVS